MDISTSKVDRIAIYRSKGMTLEDARRHAEVDHALEAEKYLNEQTKSLAVDVDEIGSFPEVTDVDLEPNELNNDLCDLTAIVAVHTEAAKPISDSSYKMMTALIQHLYGKKNSKIMKLEDASEKQMTSRQLTLHLESTGTQAIKDMWNKIKQTFINSWNKIKGWFVKAFSGARKIGEKAKAIRTVSENKQGTIINANFDGSGASTLCINNRPPEPNTLLSTLKSLTVVTQNVLGKTPAMYTNILKQLTDQVEKLADEAKKQEADEKNNTQQNGAQNQQGANAANTQDTFTMGTDKNSFITTISGEVNNLKKSFNGVIELWDTAEASKDNRFSSMATNAANELFKSNIPYFGDVMFVVTIPNLGTATTDDGIAAYRNGFGATIEPIKPNQNKPEDTANFKTLMPPQIQQACDCIIDSCKAALDYQMAFKERDACFNNLTKNLDRAASQAGDTSSRANAFIRKNITAATTITSKINNIEGRWYKYSMNVFQKTLGYCQNSLNNIK